MPISDWMASLALINGTAGGIVLVLPIIGLDAGWLTIPIVVFLTSLCCYYTAVIMFQHLGNAKTINQCIRNHFRSQKVCQFYNLIMFLSFFGQMLIYYDLLVDETEGILYFLSQQIRSDLPYFVAIFLLTLTILARYFHFEDDLLGYGILSIVAFCAFIVWIFVNKQPGPKTLGPVENNFIDLAAAMSQGYSIHNMMIPIILRAQNPNNYKKILGNVFFIAALIYTFIAYGSFAILNRYPNTGTGQTVQDYFDSDQWEIYILRGIYIINIITVFPEFLSISRIRFFNLFSEEQVDLSRIGFRQMIYYLVILFICLLTKILHLKPQTIIQLNGAVICFLQIYFIPIAIHLKCIVWNYVEPQYSTQFAIQHLDNFSKPTNRMSYDIKQQKYIEKQKQQQINTLTLSSSNNQKPQNPVFQQDQSYTCQCHSQLCEDQSTRYRQISISAVVLGIGIFITIYTLFDMFRYKKN